MNLLEAIFLGIIQGLTEFLPISSSGHLAIFEKIFGMDEAGISFDIFLHVGTLIAVILAYWKDIVRLFFECIGIMTDIFANAILFIKSKRNNQVVKYRKIIRSAYRKFAVLVIVSTIPTGIIGMLGRELIDKSSDTLIVPGICLLVTAVLLFMSDNIPDGSRTPKAATYANAIFIGVCQGIATLPGLSRSGTTITAGLLCGLRRDFAVKYSFIMSIPAIIGATILEVPNMKQDIASTSAVYYIVGIIISAIVGFVCIKTMLLIVKNKKFKYFAYYCAVIGLIAIIASFII